VCVCVFVCVCDTAVVKYGTIGKKTAGCNEKLKEKSDILQQD